MSAAQFLVSCNIGRCYTQIAYCLLFGLSLIFSWILRELAAPLMESAPWINQFHKMQDREWFRTDAVLRVTFGNFVFFAILAVLMIGIKSQKDPRVRLYHGCWMAKIYCWFVVVLIMFLVPNGVVSFYESFNKLGSGLFLLVQAGLLLDFVYSWNDSWVSKDEHFWYMGLLVVSLVCYIAMFIFSGFLFHWFAPSGHDCGLNTFFIFVTLFLVFVFAIVALHPKVNGSLLAAASISVYCTYLCYSALASEPLDYACNAPRHTRSKAISAGRLTIDLLTTVLSVVYSAIRAGSSTKLFSSRSSPLVGENKPILPFDKVEGQDEQSVPVSYSSFFFLVFSLASVYSAMLLTGWSGSVGESGKLVDVGWPSVWVRIVVIWEAAVLFIWSLIVPILFPGRDF